MVTSVSFQNFRNLTLKTDLSDSVTLIAAPNGAGKSNFLDGLYHLSRARSFRPFTEGNTISWQARIPFARIDASLADGRKLGLVVSEQSGRQTKRYEVNGAGKRRADFSRHLQTVLFAPQDLDLVSGAPEVRRAELDEFLSMQSRQYENALRDYKKVLRQRNTLLGLILEGRASERELPFWDEQLISLGSELISQRIHLLRGFVPVVRDLAASLFGGEVRDLDLSYESKFADLSGGENIAERFGEKLEQGRLKERAAGRTLYGPHRDDLIISFGGRPMRIFGSRGQQRLAALIIKLAMLDVLRSEEGTTPVLLLDDIMSELDPVHRSNMEQLILDLGIQTVVTGTDTAQFSADFVAKTASVKL
ncbi:MAG: DNA replication and repair protein RecF [candidate division WS6 bacterium OLB20]|uniref:DNA replication and repair protein RecF n=1 Tax=candidate division WS6 bacterium OLB20 TaxID=1617426 RepID=A0A136LVN1_9BACT|nr:MAG: DNA replication and repair protein RecF [candidate division WS6 bacterium OLB20]